MVQVRKLHSASEDGQINIDAWVSQLQTTLHMDDVATIRKACRMVQRVAVDHTVAVNDKAFGNCFYGGLEITEILAELKLDLDSLVAGLLYRAVREERISLLEVEKEFGETVAKLIEGVQQMDAISAVRQLSDTAVLGSTQRQTENVRKMLVALVDDVRVALIKLAERVWAIRAVKNTPLEIKQKVARDVSDIYAPLAHRLGIGHIKWELEDIAFRYLSPERYAQIAKLLDGRRLDREEFISSVINVLETQLRAEQIDASVTGRAKHIYSIARKMENKHIDFDQVYDASALRVLVPEIKDCYTALGIVHSLWRHIPKEFDDYIATPKSNGYRSLHTAVIGPEGKPIEVQIRTHSMHEEAEFGVCSHWQYKGADKSAAGQSYEEKIGWLRQVLQWHEEVGDISSLAEELKVDIEADRIYVFTPEGHVVELVRGATPVDFAYRVHTEIGNHCRGARVNKVMVPLNHLLQTGDQVEILTAANAVPRRDWLNPSLGFTNIARTRNKIQHWFKLQDKDKNAAAGRLMAEREVQRLALHKVDYHKLARKVNYKTSDDMFAAIGAGDLRVSHVVSALQQLLGPHIKRQQLDLKLPSAPARQVTAKASGHDVEFQGAGDLMSHIAGCCKPVHGDDCLGYVTLGRGVSIHRRDCTNIIRLEEEEPERIINVSWSHRAADNYAVDILIRALDRPGLLHDVTRVLIHESVNVVAMHTNVDQQHDLMEMRMTIDVPGLVVLGRVLDKIGQLPNLVEVKRCHQGAG